MSENNNNELSVASMNSGVRIPKNISNADQECISFLMTLKHRAVTPPLSSRPSASANVNSRRSSRSFPQNAPATMTENDTLPSSSNVEFNSQIDSQPHLQSQLQSQLQPPFPIQSNNLQPNVHSSHSLPCPSPSPTAISRMGAMGTVGAMSMPLATNEDEYYLTAPQCFIRRYCLEFFVSDGLHNDNNNIHSNNTNMLSTTCGSGGGGRGPVSAGRVGIRCSFCKLAPLHTRACQSMSFPSNLSGISGAVGMIQCRHLSQCHMMPLDVRARLNALKMKGSKMNWSGSPGRQQFWVESAKKLGFYDTHDGIRFASTTCANLGGSDNTAVTATPRNVTSARTISPLFQSPLPIQLSSSHMNFNHYNYQSPTSCANFNASEGSFKVGSTSTMNKTTSSSSSHNFSMNQPQQSTSSQTNHQSNAWKENKANATYDYFDSMEDHHKCHSTSSQNQPSLSSTLNRNEQLIDQTKPNDFKEEAQVHHTPSQVQSQPTQDNATTNTTPSTPTTPNTDATNITDEKLIELMGDTNLVRTQDKDLVPDYLFLAMAQMKPCRLTDADRVGCYKEREIGFLGMSCKHCGGQPGFGKYFPEKVRSLAQTTTSQTIVKHIAIKCRLCPPEVRLAVVALQADQANRDKAVKDANKSSFESRPRYGSRKIFFQRLWSRLHGEGGKASGKGNAANGTSLDAGVGNKSTISAGKTKRRAVVSPHLEDSQSCPTKFTNRWQHTSITHHMMSNEEDCNADQTHSKRNNSHNHSRHRNTNSRNEKRSRSVSYVHGENETNQYNPRRKMGRVVSSN